MAGNEQGDAVVRQRCPDGALGAGGSGHPRERLVGNDRAGRNPQQGFPDLELEVGAAQQEMERLIRPFCREQVSDDFGQCVVVMD